MIVDANGLQYDGRVEDILSWEQLPARLRAFGWEAAETDGHNCAELLSALQVERGGKPYAVIARTVKGKGVSFMEGEYTWHDHALVKDDLLQARKEVGLL